MALSRSPLRDAIQSVYAILVNQLCTKDIREDLFVEEIIDMPLMQTIQNKSNLKEANEALIDHLYTSGTVELVERFIKVLRDTSSNYKVHEEMAQKLEGAVHEVRIQSLSRQSEVNCISTVCAFIVNDVVTHTNDLICVCYNIIRRFLKKYHSVFS